MLSAAVLAHKIIRLVRDHLACRGKGTLNVDVPSSGDRTSIVPAMMRPAEGRCSSATAVLGVFGRLAWGGPAVPTWAGEPSGRAPPPGKDSPAGPRAADLVPVDRGAGRRRLHSGESAVARAAADGAAAPRRRARRRRRREPRHARGAAHPRPSRGSLLARAAALPEKPPGRPRTPRRAAPVRPPPPLPRP